MGINTISTSIIFITHLPWILKTLPRKLEGENLIFTNLAFGF